MLPIEPEDGPIRAMTVYDDDVNVKNKIIQANRMIFKRLDIDIRGFK